MQHPKQRCFLLYRYEHYERLWRHQLQQNDPAWQPLLLFRYNGNNYLVYSENILLNKYLLRQYHHQPFLKLNDVRNGLDNHELTEEDAVVIICT